MTSEIITAVIGLIVSICSSCVSWLLAKRKYNSEVDNNLIHNMKESLDFYDKLSNDNKERLHEALLDNKEMREDLDKLIDENKQLKKEIDLLRNQIVNIATSICTDLSCLLRKRDYSTLNMKNDEESNSK